MKFGIHYKYKLVFFLSGCVLLLAQCRKDKQIQEDGANAFKTTPYVIERGPGFPLLNVPSDNPLTEEGVLLGRMLFYDPILSADSTQSCFTCHRQNRGFTDSRRFSKGINGSIGTRNSMPLFNLMWQTRFFWDGRANSLREQVLMPIQAHDEMNHNLYDLMLKLNASDHYKAHFKNAFNATNITPDLLAKGLEQFLNTITSFDAKIDKLRGVTDTLSVLTSSELRGLNLFMSPVENGGADCFHCHSNIPFFGNTGLENNLSNNGLDAVFSDIGYGKITGRGTDNGKFRVPSLRNVEVTGPYMHDGRFETLEEVLDFYSTGIKMNSPNLDPNLAAHPNQLNLTAQQKDDIIAFLRTLTDTVYLNNAKYKSPF